MAEPEAALAHWLESRGIEGSRRIARQSGDAILVSKFEPGFAARLYEALDRVPELFDEAEVRRRYAELPPETNRVEAWRLAVNALLAELGPARGLDPDQLAEIRAGTDSVAALLDSCLWTAPAVASSWQPSTAEREAYTDALARIDLPSPASAAETSAQEVREGSGVRAIFTRYYGDFEGKRVENHCPGAPVARRLFAQAWAVVG